MKDLDFDELDRAVTSALGGGTTGDVVPTTSDSDSVAQPVTSPTPAATLSSSTVVSSSPVISSHATNSRITAPARTTLSRAPLASTDAMSPSPSKRIIPHREGRFMDVVAPNRATVPTPTPTPAISTPVQSPTVSQAPTPPAPQISEPTPVAVPTPSVEAPTPAPVIDMAKAMDDLLASETPVEPSVSSPADTAPEPEVAAAPVSLEVADAIPAASLDVDAANIDTPVDSPFLPDAKVEKRPLGNGEPTPYQAPAPTETTPAVTPAVDMSEPALVDEAQTPTVEGAAEEAPLPEELQGDLLAVESEAAEKEAASEAASDSESEPAGPTAIARQYKDTVKKASEDDETGAIFDPQTYQQPMEEPAKKSFKWGWVVAIVVLLILAIGAAVVAYYGGLLPVAL